MPYMLLSGFLIAVEAYRLFLGGGGGSPPGLLPGLVPFGIACGVLRVPSTERPAVLLLAVCFALASNRDVFGDPRVGSVLAILAATVLFWVGNQVRGRECGRRGWYGLAAVAVAFVGVWMLTALAAGR
jgi:hypothetical protein